MTDRHKGLLITLTGVLILTPDTMLLRLIGADIGTMLFWRGLLIFLGFWVFFLARMGLVELLRLCLATGRVGLLSASLYICSSASFVYATFATSVANLLIIVSTAPMWAALFSLLILREPVPKVTVMAMLGCLLGIVIVFYQGVSLGGSIDGELAGLAVAIAFGLNLTIIRKHKRFNMVPVNALGALALALICLPWAQPLALNLQQFGWSVLLNAIIIPLSFGLIFTGPRYLHSAEVSLFLLLETVLGPLWVLLVLDEQPSVYAYIGGAIVVTTLFCHALVRLRTR